MKRLLLFPVVLPLCGALDLLLSSAESLVVSGFHPFVDPVGQISFDFIVQLGLAQGLLLAPVFLLWDLLRNKRRPIDLETGFGLFFRQLLWPIFYATVMIALYASIPGLVIDAIDDMLADNFPGYAVYDYTLNQALAPYIFNAAAILFASTRFVLRSVPASPSLLWSTFRNSWRLVPSRS